MGGVILRKKTYSKYLPALNSCFVNGIRDEYIKKRGRWQEHYKENQFDVFKSTCDVRCVESLLSAGHEPYLNVTVQYEQLQTRDKESTMLMGDSGGFQIATNKLTINWQDADNVDKVRLGILRFLEENCNIAATLDVPTFTIGKPGFKFNTFDQCLQQTINNLDFWMKHRVPGKIRLLNVIQGRNDFEVDTWFNAVKDYQTEGWCFSSANSDSVYHIIRTLLLLLKHDKLKEHQNWIHILGRTMPAVSVILTDLQNYISEYLGTEIQISYDSSSFVQAAITGSCLDNTLTQKLSIGMSKADLSYEACKDKHITLSEYLGSQSVLGKSIYLDQMYIWHETEKKWYWDVPTYAQVMVYNYEMTVHLMKTAHEMYDDNDIAAVISQVKNEILPSIFSQKTPDEMLEVLATYKPVLLNGILKYVEPVTINEDLFDFEDVVIAEDREKPEVMINMDLLDW